MYHPLLLPLNRPQYVPVGEVLVSEVARRALSWRDDGEGHPTRLTSSGAHLPSEPPVITDPNAARTFLARDRKNAGVSVAPSTPAQTARFAASLRGASLQTDAPDAALSRAFIEAATGLRSAQGKGSSASPMSRNLALSQNLRGVLGAPRPPDMAGILEAMYSLGDYLTEGLPDGSMGSRWIRAAATRIESDPVLRSLDIALGRYASLDRYDGDGDFEDEEHNDSGGLQSWTHTTPGETPFRWLRDSWIKLTDDEWVRAIPPRVWADWCSMVLRMGLAFGFLWECRWFEAIGRSALQDGGQESLDAQFSTPLLPWPAKRLPVASRNVKPVIRLTSSRAVAIRAAILAHDKSHRDERGRGASFQDAVDHLRTCQMIDPQLGNGTVRDNLKAALTGRNWNRATNNMYETILYSLQQRSTNVLSEDYYGFLRARGGRYSIVSPGTEWIAVVASLAADHPGGETHLGQIMASLARLGLQPELQELVEILEAAGLARGSADADHGVRVRSAF